jgi:hypothetical protein
MLGPPSPCFPHQIRPIRLNVMFVLSWYKMSAHCAATFA